MLLQQQQQHGCETPWKRLSHVRAPCKTRAYPSELDSFPFFFFAVSERVIIQTMSSPGFTMMVSVRSGTNVTLVFLSLHFIRKNPSYSLFI